MKKVIIFASVAAAVILASNFFTSCNKDEVSPTPTPDYPEHLSGNYYSDSATLKVDSNLGGQCATFTLKTESLDVNLHGTFTYDSRVGQARLYNSDVAGAPMAAFKVVVNDTGSLILHYIYERNFIVLANGFLKKSEKNSVPSGEIENIKHEDWNNVDINVNL